MLPLLPAKVLLGLIAVVPFRPSPLPRPLTAPPARLRTAAVVCRDGAENAAADADHMSLRQRLKSVQVDRALLAEVTAVVAHRPVRGRNANDPNARARAGLPLYNPYGAKPCFVASASSLKSIPAEGLPEIAFIGRSNVGKSSLLNALTGMTSLAKVSDKPGKTRALNFFELGRKDKAFMLVDMPGYGFAFAKDEDVAAWRELSAEYLSKRSTLKLVLVLLDAKVGLKETDLQMFEFLEACKVKYAVVFTKADAAGPPPRAAQVAALALNSIRRARHFERPASIVSSRTGAGVGRLQRRLIETATGVDPMADVDGGWRTSASGMPRGRGRGATPGRGASRLQGRGAARGRGGGRGARGRGGAGGSRSPRTAGPGRRRAKAR